MRLIIRKETEELVCIVGFNLRLNYFFMSVVFWFAYLNLIRLYLVFLSFGAFLLFDESCCYKQNKMYLI